MNSEKPAFKGLYWYRDQYYSFFIPLDWHRFDWPDERQGVIYGPSPDEPETVFAVEVKDMGMTVEPDDLEDLSYGFLSAIKQLPAARIESKRKWVAGKMLALEARYTFDENGMRRKRWARVLYQATRQVAMTAQGATEESFDYWLPMFYEAMMTAKVHSTKPTHIG